MSAANRSAVTTPLTRIDFSMSPVAIVTVRNAVISGFAASVAARCFASKASPASAATTASATTRLRETDALPS